MNQYFHRLGLPPQASLTDIKAAYRKLALVYHPDRNPDNAEAAQRFREITEAYQALADWKQEVNKPNYHRPHPQDDYNFPPYEKNAFYTNPKKAQQDATDAARRQEKKLQYNLQYEGKRIVAATCPNCGNQELRKIHKHKELHGINYVPLLLNLHHCDQCGNDFIGTSQWGIGELTLQLLSILLGFVACAAVYYAGLYLLKV